VTDPAGKARALYEARRTLVPIPPFTDADPGLGIADGYAIQRELVPLLLADGDRVIGYKVGLTSKPMQRMIGVELPRLRFGTGLDRVRRRRPGARDRFIEPKLEAEIVFVLAEELAGPGVSTIDARRAILGAAAVELVDSRIPDWWIKLADTVSDLTSDGRGRHLEPGGAAG
jgi:2-keto-4-pentenoate hydratase